MSGELTEMGRRMRGRQPRLDVDEVSGDPSGPKTQKGREHRAGRVIPAQGSRSLRIINTWDQHQQAGGDRIVISYHPGHSRSPIGRGWCVLRYKDGQQMVTKKNAAWYEHGCQWFYQFSGRKLPQEVVDWVTERYGKRDFVRNRMRDYVEREVNERFPIPKDNS